jgi:hypothetical protein
LELISMKSRPTLAGPILAVLFTACVGPSRFFDLESPAQTESARLSDGLDATVAITSNPSGALIEVQEEGGGWRAIGDTPLTHDWPTRLSQPGRSKKNLVQVRWVYRGEGERPAEEEAREDAESAVVWDEDGGAPSVRAKGGDRLHSLAKVRKFPTIPLLGIPIPDFLWVGRSGFQYRYAGLETLSESEPETVSYQVKVRASKEGHRPQQKTITIPGTEAVHFELKRTPTEELYISTLRFLTTPPESVVGVAVPVAPSARTPWRSTWSQPRVVGVPDYLGDGAPVVPLDPHVSYGTRSDGFWPMEGFENLPIAGRGLQFAHEPGPRDFSWAVFQALDGVTQALDPEYQVGRETPIEYWVQARGHWPAMGHTSLARATPQGGAREVEVELVPMKRRRIGAKSFVWLDQDGESGIRENLEFWMRQIRGSHGIEPNSALRASVIQQIASRLAEEGTAEARMAYYGQLLEAVESAPLADNLQELTAEMIALAGDALDDLSTLRSAYPADLATGALVGQPFLQVLERQQVDRFFDERELSEAEIYDADQRPVFDQLGVEYLILGTCSIRPDGMVLSLRTVEVLTGEVIASARAEASSVEKAVDAAVMRLTQRMAVLFRAQDG